MRFVFALTDSLILELIFFFSESPLLQAKSHRISGVGSNLKRSSSPTPLPKQALYNRSQR